MERGSSNIGIMVPYVRRIVEKLYYAVNLMLQNVGATRSSTNEENAIAVLKAVDVPSSGTPTTFNIEYNLLNDFRNK